MNSATDIIDRILIEFKKHNTDLLFQNVAYNNTDFSEIIFLRGSIFNHIFSDLI